MGCLFVPLTSDGRLAGGANTDAGLASALLNVGQQVGGALGLSVMATVFGHRLAHTPASRSAGQHSSAAQPGDRRLQPLTAAAGDELRRHRPTAVGGRPLTDSGGRSRTYTRRAGARLGSGLPDGRDLRRGRRGVAAT